MRNLDKVVARIESELDEKDQIREVALKSSRATARMSGNILRKLHRGEDIEPGLAEVKDEVSRLKSLLTDHPEFEHAGYIESAFQEFAEVGIVMSLLEKGDVPSPEDLGVSNIPYLLALGDSIGELRRLCLTQLKAGNVVEANHMLEMMEDLFAAIMRFDYPDAIVAIRHKQDSARGVLEKTRGEVAVAASSKELQERLDKVLKDRG